ncbi:MAG: hypothetical protein HYT87_13130 [Nitrospirae bacterium]|nr:hypothetical protein [Nitrospirota bacterium]
MKRENDPLQNLVSGALRGEPAAERYFRELGEKVARTIMGPATRGVLGTLQQDLGNEGPAANDLLFRAAATFGLIEGGRILSGQQ